MVVEHYCEVWLLAPACKLKVRCWEAGTRYRCTKIRYHQGDLLPGGGLRTGLRLENTASSYRHRSETPTSPPASISNLVIQPQTDRAIDPFRGSLLPSSPLRRTVGMTCACACCYRATSGVKTMLSLSRAELELWDTLKGFC